LTILPIGPRGTIREADLGGSWVWFPLIGLLIGLVLAWVYAVTSPWLAPLVVGAGVLLAWIIVTGAIHLDGFGDVCDGLYAGRTPEERLRVMKDPHLGAMAVVGLSALLLTKFALLGSLDGPRMVRALLVTPCLGRYAMALLGTTSSYARTGSGTAAAFVRSADRRSLIGATATAATAAWLGFGWTGLGLAGAATVGTFLLRSIFQRALGGVTGDALGAAGELTEVLVLFGLALATGR
jgi:adenosylcobinamide-GDP ribazoletransferase